MPLALAAAGLILELDLGGTAFAAFTLIAFSYMASLVATARHRSKQYASLSWGVLSGLLRTLDIRDPRAARHAAAVAAFARDIAREAGMGEEDQELAHTAGLLHDIGHFALSDRVFERGRVLTDEDWVAIRQHPALGADMLRDLGLYGPVAEIVRAHHERIDGRGYPDRLKGDAIPEIAKIIAVAEVYDTLTAHDTYRTPVSSFEALNELRRVSGSQLDADYVEALASVLAGSDADLPPRRRGRLRPRAGPRTAHQRGRRQLSERGAGRPGGDRPSMPKRAASRGALGRLQSWGGSARGALQERVSSRCCTAKLLCWRERTNCSMCSTLKRRCPPGVR